MTTAKILADSIADNGRRLTTFEVKAPRFILPQLSKHRQFSISCRSSRAVPVRKMIQEVIDDPVIPVFGLNRKGMVAGPATDALSLAAVTHWLDARDDAVERATEMMELGVAKEVSNRIVEPYGWFHAVISSTNYMNFFSLRIKPPGESDVQAEMGWLAVLMARAFRDSSPVTRRPADWQSEKAWHLPYVTDFERLVQTIENLKRVSAARCARVSYMPHDGGSTDVLKDLARAETLISERHSVPMEHQGCPMLSASHRDGNFVGWHQFRSELPGMTRTEFDFSILDQYEQRDVNS